MKISQEEIDAATRAMLNAGWQDYSGDLEQDIKLALEAALTIRKAAKRERQRKERDKQVQENFSAANKPADWDNAFRENMKSIYEKKQVQDSAKAPEWDGKFGIGQWEMRNGGKAVVVSDDGHRTYPFNVDVPEDIENVWYKSRTRNGQVWERCESPLDLIRPWNSRAPLTILPIEPDETFSGVTG